jgi:hypothetical protein
MQQAEEQLRVAAARREIAAREYKIALLQCIEAGMGNTKIASITGTTEAAIRMYKKRHHLTKT